MARIRLQKNNPASDRIGLPQQFSLIAVVTLVGVVATTAPTSQPADEEAVPIYGIKIPPEYRDSH